MKNILVVGGLILLFVFGAAAFNSQKQKNSSNTEVVATPIAGTPTNAVSITKTEVPLPQETDIIRTFFNLINEKKISEAISMMSNRNTNDDSVKQAYGVQFNAMNNVRVAAITETMKEGWTDTRHEYRVTITISSMDPSSANAPIPYYGYEHGDNTRFIFIVKEKGMWKIDEVATGP